MNLTNSKRVNFKLPNLFKDKEFLYPISGMARCCGNYLFFKYCGDCGSENEHINNPKDRMIDEKSMSILLNLENTLRPLPLCKHCFKPFLKGHSSRYCCNCGHRHETHMGQYSM